MKTILDPSFRYTASFDTDLKRTFARIRRDHRQELRKAVPPPAATLGNVSSLALKSAGRR
jgi:hypothetical protein